MRLSTHSRATRWLLVIVAAWTVSCDAGPASDSASGLLPEWVHGGRLVQTVSIGGDGDNTTLASVGDIYASGDEVYIADTRAPAVRVYSRTGEYLRQVGREGQGPGEYRHPNGVIGTPQETVVLDPLGANARLQFFDRAGTYSRQILVHTNSVGGRMFFRDRNGDIYLRIGVNRDTDEGVRDIFRGYVVISPDGSVSEPVFMGRARPPGAEPWQMRLPDGRPVGAVPYAPAAHWAVGPGGVVAVGDSSEYRFTISHPSRPDITVARRLPRAPVNEPERIYRQAAMTLAVRRFYPAWAWDGPDIPDEKPAFSRIRVAQTGEIWVIRQGAGEAVACPPTMLRNDWHGSCWEDRMFADIYTTRGALLGEVSLPRAVGDLQIAFLSSDFILARAEEPSGNHSVRGYVLLHN